MHQWFTQPELATMNVMFSHILSRVTCTRQYSISQWRWEIQERTLKAQLKSTKKRRKNSLFLSYCALFFQPPPQIALQTHREFLQLIQEEGNLTPGSELGLGNVLTAPLKCRTISHSLRKPKLSHKGKSSQFAELPAEH